jgi:hypothetical protein
MCGCGVDIVSGKAAIATWQEVLAKGNFSGGTDVQVSAGDDTFFGEGTSAVDLFAQKGAGDEVSFYFMVGLVTDVLNNKRINLDGTEEFSLQHFNGVAWRDAIQIINDAVINFPNASPTVSAGDGSGNPIYRLLKHPTQTSRFRFFQSASTFTLNDVQIVHDTVSDWSIQQYDGTSFQEHFSIASGVVEVSGADAVAASGGGGDSVTVSGGLGDGAGAGGIAALAAGDGGASGNGGIARVASGTAGGAGGNGGNIRLDAGGAAAGTPGIVDVRNSGTIQQKDRAAVVAGVGAGVGRSWNRDDATQNVRMYTDHSGADHALSIWEKTWTAGECWLDLVAAPVKAVINVGYETLSYDTAVVQTAYFGGILPDKYGGGGITVEIMYAGSLSNPDPNGGAATVEMSVTWERATPVLDSLNANSYGTEIVTVSTPASLAWFLRSSVHVFTPAQLDSLGVGDGFRVRVRRNTGSVDDDYAGAVNVWLIRVFETHA